MKRMLAALLAVPAMALLLTPVVAQKGDQADVQMKAAIQKEVVDGDLKGAIEIYRKIAESGNRAAAARALSRMGQCYEKLGDLQLGEARRAYEQLVRDYPDQMEFAAEARTRLAAMARANGAPAGSSMALRRVWAGPEVDLEGGVSPDGRYISFIDWSTGDLAVHDLVKGENRRLTKNPGWPDQYADFAAFSRDGKRVAYAWLGEDGSYDLRVVGIDGSDTRVIHRSKEFTYFLPLAWTSDGKQILSITSSRANTRTFGISLVSTVDGAVRTLRSVGWRFPHLALSPDEKWIAFDFAQDATPGEHDIYLIAADGSREVHLIDSPADDRTPIWAPGGHLLFASDRGGSAGLWMVPVVDGQAQGSPQLIKPDIGRIRPFDVIGKSSLYYGLTASTGEVYEADLDAKTGRLASAPSPAMNRYHGFNGTPDYSPDGESIACISLRGGGSQRRPGSNSVVVKSLKNAAEREFPLDITALFEMKWSPDSRSVLLPGIDITGQFSLHVVDTRTGERRALGVFAPADNVSGTRKGWFPDGQSVYFLIRAPADAQGAARGRLVRYHLATRKTEDIYLFKADDGDLRWVMLSPDGRQFAFWRHDGKSGVSVLQLVRVGGGEARDVFTTANADSAAFGGSPAGLSWTPDGRHLYFAAAVAPGSKEMALWRIAATGGAPEKTGALPGKVYDVVVHPSGTRIAFSTVGLRREVWVLENFLPLTKKPT
jgi:Tol biopolymer transport system component